MGERGLRRPAEVRCVTTTRLLSVIGVLAAVLAIAVPAAPATSVSSAATTTALLAQINGVRAQHGLRPVSLIHPLERAATSHSNDMLERDYFLHESGPGGEGFDRRIGHFWHPVGNVTMGEILAWGSGTYSSPAAAVRQWLNS